VPCVRLVFVVAMRLVDVFLATVSTSPKTMTRMIRMTTTMYETKVVDLVVLLLVVVAVPGSPFEVVEDDDDGGGGGGHGGIPW
jgi:cytochrome c oxidase assembly factor CtaG